MEDSTRSWHKKIVQVFQSGLILLAMGVFAFLGNWGFWELNRPRIYEEIARLEVSKSELNKFNQEQKMLSEKLQRQRAELQLKVEELQAQIDQLDTLKQDIRKSAEPQKSVKK